MVVRLMLNLGRLLGYRTDIELQEDEWERGPRIRAGELSMESESCIGEVFLASPRPRWTSREPQWPGLYFVRRDGGPTRVVEVFSENRRLFYEWSDVPTRPVTGSGLEWSDREIREPR